MGCWPANTAAVPSAISRVSEDYNSLLPKEPEELRDFAVGRCPLGWLLCEKGVRQKTDGENGNVEAAMVLQQPAQCSGQLPRYGRVFGVGEEALGRQVLRGLE